MATEVRQFAVTIPAGTPVSAPISTSVSFPPMTVTDIDVTVPPGPSGNVGFQITSGGIPVVPVQAGQWFVTDSEVLHWAVSGTIESGAWQITGYNTGIYDHTLQVRFTLEPVLGPTTLPMVPASATAIEIG